LGAYYDIQKNVIRIGSGVPGSITFYDVAETGEVTQSGSWEFDDPNCILRSFRYIRDGVLL